MLPMNILVQSDASAGYENEIRNANTQDSDPVSSAQRYHSPQRRRQHRQRKMSRKTLTQSACINEQLIPPEVPLAESVDVSS